MDDLRPSAGDERPGRGRVVATVVAFWLVAVALQAVVLWQSDPPVLGRNDDLMRLAQVADLQEGQDWYDLTQYRLNPPEGTSMHWSRHVDVPVGGLIAVFGGPGDGPERAAMIVYPLLLLLGAVGAVAAIARTVGGTAAVPAALVVLVASAYPTIQFSPGRIDHHSLQVVLLLVAIAGLLRLEVPGWAIAGGAAAGVSVTIGLELLVPVAAVALAVASVAVAEGRPSAPPVWRFAAALTAAATGSALLFAPPGRLVAAECDVFSLPYWLALLLGGAVLAVLPLVGAPGPPGRRLRFGALAGGGLAAAVAGFGIAPECLAGPYSAVDPFLREHWLSNVTEARGLGTLLAEDPGLAAGLLVPGIVAIGYVLVRAIRSRDLAGSWSRLLPVLLLSYGIALVQIRGATAATTASAAVLGVTLVAVRERLLVRSLVTRIAALFGFVLVASGLLPMALGALARGGAGGEAGSRRCIEQVRELDRLPPAVIAGPIDLGPSILAFTGHSVLAAPYHRNNDGNLAAWRILTAFPEQGPEIFDDAGATLVAVCPHLGEIGYLVDLAPEGLLAALLADRAPAWLEEVDLGTADLRVYRVTDE